MTTTQPTRIGKTTVAACVGSIFARVRHDDRVVVHPRRDLYHAADLILTYRDNEVEVASLPQVTVCGDAS
jgi:hypothetical protein